MRLTRLANIPENISVYDDDKIQVVCPNGTFLNKMNLLEQQSADYSNYWVLIYDKDETPDEMDAAKLNFMRFVFINYRPGYKFVDLPVRGKFLMQFSIFSDGVVSKHYLGSFVKTISYVYNLDKRLVFLKWKQIEEEFLHKYFPISAYPDVQFQIIVEDGKYDENTGHILYPAINRDWFDLKNCVFNRFNSKDFIKKQFIMSILTDSKWTKFIELHW